MMVVKSKTKKQNIIKKATRTKKCLIIRILKFNHYEDCLFNIKPIQQTKQWFKSEAHDVYTQQINKIALCSNDGKRLQTFDRNTTDSYGTNTFKECPSKHLLVLKTSSRQVLKMSSTRLERNSFSSSKTSCKDVLKTS